MAIWYHVVFCDVMYHKDIRVSMVHLCFPSQAIYTRSRQHIPRKKGDEDESDTGEDAGFTDTG